MLQIQQKKEQEEIEAAYAMSHMPMTNRRRKSTAEPIRSIEEFIDDQIKYEAKKFENLKEAIIKDEAEQISYYCPNINQKSIDILMSKGYSYDEKLLSDQVGEARRKKKMDSYLTEKKEKESKFFKPQINEKSKNINRKGIDPLLEDAERRKFNQT